MKKKTNTKFNLTNEKNNNNKGLLGVMPLDHIPMGSEVENYGYR